MTAVDMFKAAQLAANGGVESDDTLRRRAKKEAKAVRAAQKIKDREDRYQASGRVAPSARMPAAQSQFHFQDDRPDRFREEQFRNKYQDIEKEDDALTKELFENHSNTGINFSKYKDIAVDVQGTNVPKPIKRFDEIALPPVIIANLKLAQWDVPTPIQQHALPIGFAGRDIMGCAQTGSGKTAAFLFPIINRLWKAGVTPRNSAVATPGALVIVPTRELAQQISIEAIKFTYRSPLKSVVVYGGTGTKRDQYQALRNGCDILIGTPGRLIDFLSGGAIELSRISFLCLDEADRMLDMGFEAQMTQILKACPLGAKRQTLMFSATFPDSIQYLAKTYLKPDYVFIAVGRVGAAVAEIKQQIFFVDEVKKFDELIVLLKGFPVKTLIFVKTKITADTLANRLKGMKVPCDSIHGDKEQPQREYALGRFKQGILKVLVATDVASRGLDIPEVGHVINYDLPGTIDDYTHRIGRTGRIGQPGLASSFFNDGNNNIKMDLKRTLKQSKQEVPAWLDSDFGSGGGRGRKRY